ncbi:MAG TPA: response regulator [Flavisolibacter sp.]|jgi:two-component system response regulator
MTQQQKTILYVDDDEDDRDILSHAMREVSPDVGVVLAEDGIRALDYLNRQKERNAQLPGLIVLDINMPYLDGRQTFEKIRSNPGLENIPIIIFTSSENPQDKALFKSQGVELITKPDNIHYMNRIVSYMVSHCARS